MRTSLAALALCLPLVALVSQSAQAAEEGPPADLDVPVEPLKKQSLLSGDDMSGWYTWLKDHKYQDPDGVFQLKDGVLHVSGAGGGYLGTKQAYKNYHLSLEYKWGERNPDSKYVRNSGVLLHAQRPDGAKGGLWAPSIECQLAQGCEGDIIVIPAPSTIEDAVPITVASEIRIGTDGRTRWQPGGKKAPYRGKQFWWKDHDPTFKELIDTRGSQDVASPLGEWTKVDCICTSEKITIKINGVTVNEVIEVWPIGGRILLQNEGHAVMFRNVEIAPLAEEAEENASE